MVRRSVVDPDWIRIQWGPWVRIRIRIRNRDPVPDRRGGKNGPEKWKTVNKFL